MIDIHFVVVMVVCCQLHIKMNMFDMFTSISYVMCFLNILVLCIIYFIKKNWEWNTTTSARHHQCLHTFRPFVVNNIQIFDWQKWKIIRMCASSERVTLFHFYSSGSKERKKQKLKQIDRSIWMNTRQFIFLSLSSQCMDIHREEGKKIVNILWFIHFLLRSVSATTMTTSEHECVLYERTAFNTSIHILSSSRCLAIQNV